MLTVFFSGLTVEFSRIDCVCVGRLLFLDISPHRQIGIHHFSADSCECLVQIVNYRPNVEHVIPIYQPIKSPANCECLSSTIALLLVFI